MRLLLLFLIFLIIIYFASQYSLQSHVETCGGNERTKSEAYVIRELERLTCASFPTARPNWLRWKDHNGALSAPLELDGYNKNLKIALEFSGPYHTKWYPNVESYSRYYWRLVKDRAKLIICKKHGINLIVVDMGLPQHLLAAYLKSRLFDAKFIKDKPFDYIDEQVAVPYRNYQQEKELNLPLLLINEKELLKK